MDVKARTEIPAERGWLGVSILLGALGAWFGRYAMNPDGISYLDIGNTYASGAWKTALNAYWSPMYSWILGLSLWLFRPDAPKEFQLVHAVNFAIFLGALFSFRFLLHAMLENVAADDSGEAGRSSMPLPRWILISVAYGLFLWCALVLIDLWNVTPDLLVAAFVFLMAGSLLRLQQQDSYRNYVICGLLAGGAYLSKGIMFLIGWVFLTIILSSRKLTVPRFLKFMLSAAVFLAVAALFIVGLSKQKGRLTFGDTGKLGYARLVSPGTPEVNWQGEPAGSGRPVHTTRKILEHPAVFEFAQPVGGAYPPWYDPSYWNEGTEVHFRLRRQLRVVAESLLFYGKLFLDQSALAVGILALVMVGGKSVCRSIARNWPLLSFACIPMLLYALVLVKTRYIGAFLLLIWLVLLFAVRLPVSKDLDVVSKQLAIIVTLTLVLSVVQALAEATYRSLTVGREPPAREQIEVAEGLQKMGLQPGDKVAVIGDGLTDYWAYLGRFKIVSQLMSGGAGSTEFWASDGEHRLVVYQALSRTGARGVVTHDPPVDSVNQEDGWEEVDGTRYYVHFLTKQ